MVKKTITAIIPLTMLLLLFQNCGNQFQGNPGFQSLSSTDGSDQLQDDSDGVTDGTKNVTSAKYNIYLWDNNKASSLYFDLTDAENMQLIIEDKSSDAFAKLEFQFSAMKEYSQLIPKIFATTANESEPGRLYLLSNDGLHLVQLLVDKSKIALLWEVELLAKVSSSDFSVGTIENLNAQEVLRIGRNVIGNFRNATPEVVLSNDCHTNEHLENGQCVANERPCDMSNGAGNQKWSSNKWGACTPVSCNSGYYVNDSICTKNPTCTSSQHLENNVCVSNTRACAVSHGVGSQAWTGSSWSAVCTVVSCDVGYSLEGTACTQTPTCTAAQHLESNKCVSNTRSCAISNGTGSQAWTGTAWSATCTLVSCNSGYTANNGVCTAVTTPVVCSSSQHLENGQCVSNTRSCAISNGTGSQAWTGTAWSTACTVVSCNSGYTMNGGACTVVTAPAACSSSQHMENGQCVSNTRSCAISNGTGSQTWTGTAWSTTCTLVSCNAQSYLDGGICHQPTRNAQGDLLSSSSLIVAGEETQRIFALDNVNVAIYEINRGTGARSLVSGYFPNFSTRELAAGATQRAARRGVGPAFGSARRLFYNERNNELYIFAQVGESSDGSDVYGLIKVDIATGNRSLLTTDGALMHDAANIGLGYIHNMVFSKKSRKAFAVTPTHVSSFAKTGCMYSIDLDSGAVQILPTGCTKYTGGTLGRDMYLPQFALSSDETSAYFFRLDRVMRINFSTNTRTETAMANSGNWALREVMPWNQGQSSLILGSASSSRISNLVQLRANLTSNRYELVSTMTPMPAMYFGPSLPISVYSSVNSVFLTNGFFISVSGVVSQTDFISGVTRNISNNGTGSSVQPELSNSVRYHPQNKRLYGLGKSTSPEGEAQLLEIRPETGESTVIPLKCWANVSPRAMDGNHLSIDPVSGDIFILLNDNNFSTSNMNAGLSGIGGILRYRIQSKTCELVSGRTASNKSKGTGDHIRDGADADASISVYGQYAYVLGGKVSASNLSAVDYGDHLFRVDLSTGNRTVLDATNFNNKQIRALDFSSDGAFIYASGSFNSRFGVMTFNVATQEQTYRSVTLYNSIVGRNNDIFGMNVQGIVKLDLTTEVLTQISSSRLGNGPSIVPSPTKDEITLDSENNVVYYFHSAEKSLYRIDIITGNRELAYK